MTLVSPGNPIALAGSATNESVALEIGGTYTATSQISCNDAKVAQLAGVTAGAALPFSNFYGKTEWATPVISSFVANPTSVPPSNSSVLTPTFTAPGGSASIDNGVGTVTSGTGYTVTPSSTTTYTLTATNGFGAQTTATATVTVTAASAIRLTGATHSVGTGTYSNIANAYDTFTTTVDTTTFATMTVLASSGAPLREEIWIFAAGGIAYTYTGNLYVRFAIPTCTVLSPASGSWGVFYSLDGGSTYTVINAGSTNGATLAPTTYTIPMVNQAVLDIRVKTQLIGQFVSPQGANIVMNLYDMVFVN